MMRWRHREPYEHLARNLYRQYVSLTSRLRHSSLRYTDISDRHQSVATLRRLENVPLMGAQK
ncbi:MAG: hypothetical protein PUG41_06330 [Prevotellaceae bacterium]|nr:hypothetical protein [Prevotellaceae bacterium]